MINEFDLLSAALNTAIKHAKHNQKTHGRWSGRRQAYATGYRAGRAQGLSVDDARKLGRTASAAFSSDAVKGREFANDDEAHQAMMESLNKRLLKRHTSAFLEYAGPDYERINSALRSGDSSDKVVKILDETIARNALPENTVVYRGSRFRANSSVLEALKTPGSVVTDLGYTSTTVSKETAESFSKMTPGELKEGRTPVIMNITAPAGTKAVYGPEAMRQGFDDDSPSEYEVLMARNTNMIVRSTRTERRRVEILAGAQGPARYEMVDVIIVDLEVLP